MPRYRKKPVEVEAWQVGSDEPMPDWVIECNAPYEFAGSMFRDVRVAEFDDYVPCLEGWYLVRSDNGRFDSMNPSEFFHYHEVVE